MFVRGVYSPAEQEGIDRFYARAAEQVGWIGDMYDDKYSEPVRFRTAELGVMTHQAYAVDFKNLLYRDEDYARKSRWGGIIAPPFFCKSIVSSGPFHWPWWSGEAYKYVEGSLNETFTFYKPIRPGDSFRVWFGPSWLEDVTPDGEQPYRTWSQHQKLEYYNQRDELVCIVTRDPIILMTEPGEVGVPVRDLLPMGYDLSGAYGPPIDFGEIKQTKEWCYSKEDAQRITEIYANEVRRGNVTRYWEDVEVGEEIPAAIYGPITVWDEFITLATFGTIPRNMNEVRAGTPFMAMNDPATNISHNGLELHLGGFAPGQYSFTVVETFIENFLGRVASNWMGDDGMIRTFRWDKMANTAFGDTAFGRGKVLRKYVDEEGKCLVDLVTYMELQRGYISNACPVTVELPSRTKERYGTLPGPCGDSVDLNPDGIQAGDRVRIKERPDWELVSPYPLAGKTATVYKHFEVDGFTFLVLDDPDATGLDPRVCLGFRLDQLEKI